MTRMTTGLCFYKNCDPKELCASVPGLYTCIKTWKIMYKVRLQKYVFDTCSKWAKWQNFSVDIRILSILGCRPLPRGYISPRWISRQLRRDQLFLQVRIEWFLLSTHIFKPNNLNVHQTWKVKLRFCFLIFLYLVFLAHLLSERPII